MRRDTLIALALILIGVPLWVFGAYLEFHRQKNMIRDEVRSALKECNPTTTAQETKP